MKNCEPIVTELYQKINSIRKKIDGITPLPIRFCRNCGKSFTPVHNEFLCKKCDEIS